MRSAIDGIVAGVVYRRRQKIACIVKRWDLGVRDLAFGYSNQDVRGGYLGNVTAHGKTRRQEYTPLSDTRSIESDEPYAPSVSPSRYHSYESIPPSKRG